MNWIVLAIAWTAWTETIKALPSANATPFHFLVLSLTVDD